MSTGSHGKFLRKGVFWCRPMFYFRSHSLFSSCIFQGVEKLGCSIRNSIWLPILRSLYWCRMNNDVRYVILTNMRRELWNLAASRLYKIYLIHWVVHRCCMHARKSTEGAVSSDFISTLHQYVVNLIIDRPLPCNVITYAALLWMTMRVCDAFGPKAAVTMLVNRLFKTLCLVECGVKLPVASLIHQISHTAWLVTPACMSCLFHTHSSSDKA